MQKTTTQQKSKNHIKKPLERKEDEFFKSLTSKSSNFWMQEREKNMLNVFHQASKDVPAYKDFLKKHKVDPTKIKTLKEFQEKVPVMDKKNYLRKYPIEQLCWNGTLEKPLVFTSTSGSTGNPVYFPRSSRLDEQYSYIVESFLRNSSYSKNKGPVLVVVGFGMGVWIGGLITYKAFEIAAQRFSLPVSIITPGINKPEIFKALKDLSPHYRETVLIGYPPFLKDIIDESKSQRINLKKLNIRLFSAAESYTESFREYLVKKTGIKNTQLDVTNIYGSADIGAMAWETPISILVRRLALNNKKLLKSLFPNTTKTPTLAQYDPKFTDFEAQDGNILVTGDSAVPLIRYSIGDKGGVLSLNELNSKFASCGVSLYKEAKKVGIDKNLYQLPFVYVYERDDFSTSIYGLKIYPEPVREALIVDPVCNYLTGKFTLEAKFDKKHNQYLSIALETNGKNIPKNIKDITLKLIVEKLEEKNSEYRELHRFLGKRALPKLSFLKKEDPKYFKPGVKQKWVNRN